MRSRRSVFPDRKTIRLSALLVLAGLMAAGRAVGADADAVDVDAAGGQAPWLLWHADIKLSDATRPPMAEAGWTPIVLPDLEGVRVRGMDATRRWDNPSADGGAASVPTHLTLHDRDTKSVWYRFAIPHGPPPSPWSVYLWRFSMNAEAYFNDELIGSGGSFGEPMARNWNRPLLFPIPGNLWRDSENFLYIRVGMYSGWGTLTPPALGPHDALSPAYERRFFYQITLSQWSLMLTLTLSLVALAFWLVERRDTAYLFFMVCALSWSIYGLNAFVVNIPMSAKLWWWLVHASVDVFSLGFVYLAHRLMGVVRPVIERALALATLTGFALYAVWELPDFARYNSLVHAAMMIGPTYVTLWVLWTALVQRRSEALFLALSMSVLIALGIHDLVLSSLAAPELWISRSYLLQFGAPAMLLVLVTHLARRLAEAMADARIANTELHVRVRRARSVLEQEYEQRRLLERDTAAAAERERIYQDLHDDVGSKLLSIVYAAADNRQARLAREALGEIRSIVSSHRLGDARAQDVIADWRLEIETRCEEAHFTLDWNAHVEDVLLTGAQRYHLERILKELVSNALKHSGGCALRVGVSSSAGHLDLSVEDNGRGVAHEGSSGSGLIGIRRRVADLAGAVGWERGSAGGVCCRVHVPLPLNRGVSADAVAH